MSDCKTITSFKLSKKKRNKKHLLDTFEGKLGAWSHKMLYKRPVRKFLHYIRMVSLPGCNGMPLFDVLNFFIRGLLQDSIANRAKSMAFSFFLALFPLLLFTFTLLPYFPIEGLQQEFYHYLQPILPESIYSKVVETMNEVLNHKHNTLLSVGFLSTIIVSMNGVDSIMQAFNQTLNKKETRGFLRRKLICLLLVFMIFVLVIVILGTMMGYDWFVEYLFSHDIVRSQVMFTLMAFGRWLVMIFLSVGVISCIYYIAPTKKYRVGFFSAGSVLSTGLFFLVTWGFNYYISNFTHYNALYGSIGTIIIAMLWIQLCCTILLIGYELNISIATSKIYKKENHKTPKFWKKDGNQY